MDIRSSDMDRSSLVMVSSESSAPGNPDRGGHIQSSNYSIGDARLADTSLEIDFYPP